jgi:hypothetical protein
MAVAGSCGKYIKPIYDWNPVGELRILRSASNASNQRGKCKENECVPLGVKSQVIFAAMYGIDS